jgi:hypothetical protein
VGENETSNEAYDRGHLAGEVATRLGNHDRHFEAINGSLDKIAREMHTLTLGVQALVQRADSDAATRITTAAALKDAETVRRDKSDSSWSPWARIIALVGGLAGVSAIVGLILVLRKG